MFILNQELLTGMEFKLFSIQRTMAGRWWKYQNVISPFSRLWLVMGGGAVVYQQGRRFELKPGCLHLVPPFTAHDCSCPQALDHYHLHFVSRLSTGVDLFSLLDCPCQIRATPAMWNYFQHLEAMHPDRKLPCFDPAREEYRRFSIMAERNSISLSAVDWLETHGVLAMLLSPFIRSAKMHEGIHAKVIHQFLAVQKFIHGNINKPILLGDLARAANLHPTYFSDRFQRLVGERPLAYLMRYRLERAQFLLLTGRTTIKQVAYQVGFKDPAYFTRVFTQFWRVSPTRYRTTHSSNAGLD